MHLAKKNKILQSLGWPAILVLSFLPVVFWIFQAPLLPRFSTLNYATSSLGDIAGLCGMAMFSVVQILSARLRFLEKFFKGINESYTAHHFFGGLVFCLLLFHPLLLVYKYFFVSYKMAAMFLLPSSDMAQNLGIFGLLVMIIALAITFYTKIKYQVWRFTHRFLGLAFIFAFFHTFFIGADVASNLWLKIYLFVLGVLAIIAYLYRSLFSSFFVKVFNYKVKDIREDKDKIWEIELEPYPSANGKEIKFEPGQFAFVKILSKGKGITKEIHPYSFSSATGNPLRFAIKELGDYTNNMGQLQPGDMAEIEGPFGSFSFNKRINNNKQIWIAGGVGITPFLSMLRSLGAEHADYDVHLYYSVRETEHVAFKEEIEQIARIRPNLKINFWITKEKGFLTADLIKRDIGDIFNYDVLICGPGIMMSALKKQFAALGLKKDQVHTEDFQLY